MSKISISYSVMELYWNKEIRISSYTYTPENRQSHFEPFAPVDKCQCCYLKYKT